MYIYIYILVTTCTCLFVKECMSVNLIYLYLITNLIEGENKTRFMAGDDMLSPSNEFSFRN